MNTYHSTLGETPREAWERTHMIPKNDSEEEKNEVMCANLGHIKLLVDCAIQHGERNKRRRLKRKKKQNIEEGDFVLVRDNKKDKRTKSADQKLQPIYPWKAKVVAVKKMVHSRFSSFQDHSQILILKNVTE